MSKKKSKIKILAEEILIGFLGILGSTIDSKIGLSIFLLIIGISMLFIPISDGEEKPSFFYWIGFILIGSGFYLFYTKTKEIKGKK